MTHTALTSIADLGPLDRARQQRAWNWYDWANSAFYTTSRAERRAASTRTRPVARRSACSGCTSRPARCRAT